MQSNNASANNSKEFINKMPDALAVVKEYREKLLAGEITIWDLIVTKHPSKHFKDYKQKVRQVIAAEQLMKEGVEVSAGKNVRFLFTSAENKRHERRVKAEELIEKNTNSDTKKYLLLLYAAATNLKPIRLLQPRNIRLSQRPPTHKTSSPPINTQCKKGKKKSRGRDSLLSYVQISPGPLFNSPSPLSTCVYRTV